MKAFSKVGKTLDYVLEKIDDGKEKIDPVLDKTMFMIGANLGALYGIEEFIDNHNFSEPTNGIMMMASGAALTLGNYLLFAANKTKPARTKIKSWNNYVNKARPVSWLKTLGLGAAIFFSAKELKPYAGEIYEDIFKTNSTTVNTKSKNNNSRNGNTNSDTLTLEEAVELAHNGADLNTKVVKVQNLSTRPKVYDKLGYVEKVKYDFSGTKLADKNSDIGRIQRTLRTEPIFRAIEKKRGLPKYTLAGMIMQESYGDPVQPNGSGDGGLGLTHIQGTVAKDYGLIIYGSSTKDSDKKHGKQIKDLLSSMKYDPSKIQKYDERAHYIKVLDAAARIVTRGKNAHGTWDEGVRYYRAPGKVHKNLTWEYLQDVKHFQKVIQDKNMVEKARRDFEKRNPGKKFDDYIRKHQEMNENWGLSTYINSKL